MIDVMNDDQLKEYLKNRPDDLKTVKIKVGPSKRVRYGIICKFHISIYTC